MVLPDALLYEAGGQKSPARPYVRGIEAGCDLVQSERTKAVRDQRSNRFPGISLSPSGRIAECNADVADEMMTIERTDLDIANMPTIRP